MEQDFRQTLEEKSEAFKLELQQTQVPRAPTLMRLLTLVDARRGTQTKGNRRNGSAP
jgi:hypothetical protein